MADQNNGTNPAADPAGSAAAQSDPNAQGNNGQQANQPAQAAQNSGIDYEKIQQMLNGTLAAKEDTALKAYFKQQGMTQEEMTQAIAAFKAEKAKNTPDPTALQEQLNAANATILKMQIEQAVSLEASKLGIDPNNMPYVMKLADLSQIVGSDGKLIPEKITEAINKVLADLPALKPAATGTTGFQQVGTHNNQSAGSSGSGAQKRTEATPATKRWNRTNH